MQESCFGLSIYRKTVQFSDHQVDHILGVILGVNSIQIPAPVRRAMVEGQQLFFCERKNELNGKKWIAGGFLMHQLRQRVGVLPFAVKRVRNQLSQIRAGEGESTMSCTLDPALRIALSLRTSGWASLTSLSR
jgi:hypothetical protein